MSDTQPKCHPDCKCRLGWDHIPTDHQHINFKGGQINAAVDVRHHLATHPQSPETMNDIPKPTAADSYETMEALLCEMQGLRDQLVEVKRERDNLKQEVERLKTMSVCELGAHNNSVRDYMGHWEGRALTAERERDEALNVLREINDWINVAAMRPITTHEAADAINAWGDKIRPILEVTE